MPRPTVRKWCEHGYNSAFYKTQEDLASHFKPDRRVPEPVAPAVVEEAAPAAEPEQSVVDQSASAAAAAAATEAGGADSSAGKSVDAPVAVVATIPVTVGGKSLDLSLHEGESAEDAVVTFCKENVKDDVSACIRQMLPEVLERMEESASAGDKKLRGSA